MLMRCTSERMLKPLKLMLDALDLATLVLIGFLLMLTEYRPSWWWWSSDSKPQIQTAKRKTVKDIPGPGPALPILGTRWIYSRIGRYKLSEVHEAYKDMFAKFGSIVKEEALWNFPVVSLLDKKDIEAVLKHPSRFPLRPPTEATAYYRRSRPDRYTTLGIVNEQGETWHKLRTVLTPELTSPKTILRFVPELNVITEDFVSLLKMMRDSKGTVTNFDDYAIRMGLESTCTLILGRRLGFLERDVDSVAARLGAAVRGIFRASRDTYYGLPFWKMFPTPAYKLLVKSEEDLYDVVSEMVAAAQKEESDTYSADGVGVFFMSLLATPGLDIREKRAAIIDFVAAGIQTLGNTLIFALYLLAKNPSAQQRLFEEVSELAPSGSPFTAESLRRATYLQACVMEAFRILPTATCVARILESEMKLSGYHLPAGTVVLCHTWLACLEESNFTAAKEFRPERWLQNQGGAFTRNSPFLVVPFGCGRRICPGKRFVEQEMHLVLAKMVREFEIGFEGDLKLQFEFLLCPSGSINFTFKDRQ